MTAPLHVITGLPGNGKSLFALHHIQKRAQQEKRQVYYHGIPELTLDWIPLEDPTKWYELESGSIVVIDEAQKNGFPVRRASQQPPKHIEEFQTLRHRGFDVYLITQHPNLIDPQIRLLAGQHFHVVRKFGMQSSYVYEWNEVVNPSSKASYASAQKHNFPYPKEVYGWYRSSEIHTIKRKLPWPVIALPILFLLLIAVVFAFKHFSSKIGQGNATQAVVADEKQPGQKQLGVEPGSSFEAQGVAPEKPKPMTREEYLASFVPRVPGLPATAPRYDALMVPTQAPKIVGCMYSSAADRCTCYSQQGTVMPDVSLQMCKQIVRYGYFDDTQPVRSVETVAPPRESDKEMKSG